MIVVGSEVTRSLSADCTFFPPLSVNHKLPTQVSYSEIKQLKVANINFQSILNKVSSFHEFIHNYDPDIILGSKSWLTAEVFF